MLSIIVIPVVQLTDPVPIRVLSMSHPLCPSHAVDITSLFSSVIMF